MKLDINELNLFILAILMDTIFFQSVESSEEVKSMYNEVVLGGDVWDLLDEIMIYMNNPMQYYEKKVPFVRVILFLA